MSERGVSLSPIKWLGLVIIIVALTNIAVLLDISVLRQIFSFIFLTFIPGFLILGILKLNKLGLVEKIVLSVGLSVSFLMLFGLAVNGLSLALDYTKPLSTIPVLISFSSATIILGIIAYKRNKDTTLSFSSLKLSTREKAFLIVPSLFPLLSIVGMRIMNLTDNNMLLMVLLFLIPAYVIFISFSKRKPPEKIYPSIIWLISISLLLMLSLRSNHILGSDIHDLYYVFQLTLHEGHWGLFSKGLLDACLGISLLPTIYQSLMNINAEYLFKILYSLLFSISPVVVYVISRKYIGSSYALLACFFFMAQVGFLWTTGSSTTTMAILFFALAIMVLFHQDIGELATRLLFVIFAISAIMSHYSTSYIFFFVLLFTWIGMQIVPRILLRESKVAPPSENPIAGSNPQDSLPDKVQLRSNVRASKSSAIEAPQSQLKRCVTITIVILFFTILFFWYSQITIAAFHIGVNFIHQTFANLNQWLLLETKGPTVVAAVGEEIYTIPQRIRVVVSWLTVAFVVSGVLATMARYKRMVAIPKSGGIKPNFLQSKFETEYFVLAMACSAILVIAVALPYILVGYSMERTYFQMLTVLSPFFVVGGIMVARWLRARPHWIILPVLIPFFMCSTGMMYQIFNVPASMTLNSAGREYEYIYVHDQESYAAKWIKEYGGGAAIYTHRLGQRVLHSQGMIPLYQLGGSFLSLYYEGKKIDGYIYLRHTDITVDRVVTEYPDIFTGKNKIYATNGSEIYR